MRGIFERLCVMAKADKPTALTLWPSSRVSTSTTTGRKENTEMSAPSCAPNVFYPRSLSSAPPSSPHAPMLPNEVGGTIIATEKKVVHQPDLHRVQLAQLQGEHNVLASGAAAAFNLFIPPKVGGGVSDTTVARCLFEMSETVF